MSDRIVQFSQLGNFGRLGNQMFQYAFARAYAEKYDAVLETPEWIGEKIFEIQNRRITKHLIRTNVDIVPWGEVNIDLYGYFQTKKCFDIMSENKIRTWFTFQNKWLKYLNPSNEIIAHLRVGDYKSLWSNIFCLVDKNSILKAASQYDITNSQIIWLSEENPTVDDSLNDITYSLQSNSMYGKNIYKDYGISFLADFFRMINSKILFRSNSTFSFWAGFFKKENVYSPVVKNKVGCKVVDFVKNNHSAICDVTDDIIFGE